MSVPGRADVVVIGGGVVGCAVARCAARAGAGRVLLIERHGALGSEATGRAVGGLRFQFDDPRPLRLSLEGVRALEELGVPIERAGYLLLACDEAEAARLRRIAAVAAVHGAPVELLDAAAAHARVPALRTDDVVCASFGARDGFVDPHAAVAAIAADARAAGAEVRLDVHARALSLAGGRVAAVATDAGTIACGAAVVAAGAGAADLLEPLMVRLPLRPRRRRVFLAPPTPALPAPSPLVMQSPPPFYARAERAAILLSAAEETPPDEVAGSDFELLAAVAARAAHRIPALADAPVRFGWSGVRVLTPDGLPFAGPIAAVPGLHVAAGLGGQGLMHGLAVGAIVAAGLTGADHPLAADVAPARAASAVGPDGREGSPPGD